MKGVLFEISSVWVCVSHYIIKGRFLVLNGPLHSTLNCAV